LFLIHVLIVIGESKEREVMPEKYNNPIFNTNMAKMIIFLSKEQSHSPESQVIYEMYARTYAPYLAEMYLEAVKERSPKCRETQS